MGRRKRDFTDAQAKALVPTGRPSNTPYQLRPTHCAESDHSNVGGANHQARQPGAARNGQRQQLALRGVAERSTCVTSLQGGAGWSRQLSQPSLSAQAAHNAAASMQTNSGSFSGTIPPEPPAPQAAHTPAAADETNGKAVSSEAVPQQGWHSSSVWDPGCCSKFCAGRAQQIAWAAALRLSSSPLDKQ